MPALFNQLFEDTLYFFFKQIKLIFIISIVVALINWTIEIFISSNVYNIISIIENYKFIDMHSFLEFLNNMSAEQKNILFKYSILKILELLMNKTFLLSSIFMLISFISNNKTVSFFSSSYKFLFNLFILNTLVLLTTQLGFMLFIFPGIFFMVTLFLAPIIFSFHKQTVIDSMRFSIYLSCKHIKIIGPAVLVWIFAKFILTNFFLYFSFINKNFIFLISSVSLNIIFSFLIIYLFRFYMIFLRSQNT